MRICRSSGRVPVVGLLLSSLHLGHCWRLCRKGFFLVAESPRVVLLSSLRGLLFFWFFLHTDAIARRAYCYVGCLGAFKYCRLLGDRHSGLQGDTVPNSDNRGDLRRYIRFGSNSLRALISLMRYLGRNRVARAVGSEPDAIKEP